MFEPNDLHILSSKPLLSIDKHNNLKEEKKTKADSYHRYTVESEDD